MRVTNLANNQVVLQDLHESTFASYGTNIAKETLEGIVIDRQALTHSKTTTKWLGVFLGGFKKQEIQNRIDAGIYTIGDLN